MFPYSWVIESLNIMGTAKNVVNFLGKLMKPWSVKLTCGAETLVEVPIKRGIFQWGMLSPLLLIIVLILLTHILRTAKAEYVHE